MDYKNRISKFYDAAPKQSDILYTSPEMFALSSFFTEREQSADTEREQSADTERQQQKQNAASKYNVVVTFDDNRKLLGHTMVFCNSRKDAMQAMEEAFANIETFRRSLGDSMGVPEDVMALARFSIAIVEAREEFDTLP